MSARRGAKGAARRSAIGGLAIGGLARKAVAVGGLAVGAAGTTGCGLLLDGAYLVSDKRFQETVTERSPTTEVYTSVEVDAAMRPDGVVQLTCEERERRVERATPVTKTYERRGSFESTTYVGTAVLSGVVGGVAAGVIAALCTQEPADPSQARIDCANLVYTAPFAADVAWSIARAATAKPPKLVDKEVGTPVLALSEEPVRRAPVKCDAARVALGAVAGGSEPRVEDVLAGTASGDVKLADGATAIAVAPDGTFSLRAQPEVVRAWLAEPGHRLFATYGEERPRSLRLDRCALLRAVAAGPSPGEGLKVEDLVELNKQCPAPPPAPR